MFRVFIALPLFEARLSINHCQPFKRPFPRREILTRANLTRRGQKASLHLLSLRLPIHEVDKGNIQQHISSEAGCRPIAGRKLQLSIAVGQAGSRKREEIVEGTSVIGRH